MTETEIALKDIIRARNKCAELIAKYGKAYLPVFERLEKEIAMQEKQQILLEKALEIHRENVTQNVTQYATQKA